MSQWSYGNAAIKQSLTDDIYDLDPIETYAFTNAAKVPVTQVFHNWVTDPATVATSTTGIVEGADTTYSMTNPNLLGNMTQIFEQGVKVTYSNINSDAAGGDAFAREKMKKMKTWKDTAERAFVIGSLVTGNGTNSGRAMQGFARFASGTMLTSMSGVTLTSSLFNERLGIGYDNGAEYETALVGRTLKEKISGFTSPNTRNIDARSGEVVYRVDVYDSDHGRVKIVKHRHVNGYTNHTYATMVLYMEDAVQAGILDEVGYQDRAQTGYFKAGAIVGEHTAIVRNPVGVSTVTGLQ